MIWFSLVSMLLAAQPVQPGAEPPIGRIVTMTGHPEQEDDDEERMVVRIDRSARRFRLPASQVESFEQVLTAANSRGFAVHLRFDGAAGQIDEADGTVTYPICSVSVGDAPAFGDENINCPGQSAPVLTGSRALLARAIAIAAAHPERSIGFLDAALGDPELPARLRAVALATRAGARMSLAYDQDWAGPSYDALMVAALSDSRARLALYPDKVGAYIAVATILPELGAYDEALAINADIVRRWPAEAMESTTAIGAIWRQRGDYRRALAVLDDYASRHGRPVGMRFAYHRAWTLVMLGRFQDAIAELGIGLSSQPDYAAAYQLRSCARLSLGEVDAARRDEVRALDLRVALARAGMPGSDEEIALVRRTVEAFGATRSRRTAEMLDLSCRAPWRDWTRTRSRSPLLLASG